MAARKKSRKSRKGRKSRRKSLAKRIASVGGLNRHAPKQRRKSARSKKGQIPLPILEKRAHRLVKLVRRRGGRV